MSEPWLIKKVVRFYSTDDLKEPTLDRRSNLSDDEPVYDAVASDDDYAALAPVAQQVKLVRQQRSRSKNYSIG